ncbi:MAG TPA: LuxR C-terminal-related transcriptional regulator, partial [Candidatus Limnocylindrales bacterium]
ELAAAWTTILRPPAILRRLEDARLDLADDDRDPRQSSLRAVVDASLDLVAEPAPRIFARLGVFAGSFDEAAARAISGDENVLQALRRLADVSLVQVEADPDGEPRFDLLETVRAVARARLVAAGEADDLWRQHAAWYADRAVELADTVRTTTFSEQRAGARLADPNIDVALDRALDHGDGELAVRLAAALATRAVQTGVIRKPLARLRAAMELPVASSGVRSDGLNASVSLRAMLDETDGLTADARAALAEARRARDEIRIVRTLITIGNVTDDAAPYLEAAELADTIGYDWGAAIAWINLAETYRLAGQTDGALDAWARSEEAFGRRGDRVGVAGVLLGRGEHEIALGRVAEGVRDVGRAVAIFRTTPGVPSDVTWALSILALGHALAGDEEVAGRLLAEAADRVEAAETAEHIDWLQAGSVVLAARHPVVAARCLGAVERSLEETRPSGANRAILDASAAGIERRIGRARLDRERAAGHDAGGPATFVGAAKVVRRLAGTARGQVKGPFGSLSSREGEILAMLAEGRTDRDIAERLGISPKTASVHVSNLKAKLGVETRVEAALFARDRLGAGEGEAAGSGPAGEGSRGRT